MEPQEIIHFISNEGDLQQITTKQLNNLRAREKTKEHGPAKVNLAEFFDWCLNNTKVPDEIDEIFVLYCEYKVKTNNKIKHLRVIFTTLR